MTTSSRGASPVLSTLLVSLPGPSLPEQTARWLDRGLGGIVLFARNIEDPLQLRELCRRIREVRPDALIALDEEGGEVTRLEAAGGSCWPGARVLGTVDDTDLTTQAAGMIAAELRAAGANVNLAPVADVPTAVADPVIGNRAFGEDPVTVGRHVRAFVAGTQGGGVAACAKHVPGHGAAAADSHLELPVVDVPAAELLRRHLSPFADAVDAGVAMMMTAHVVYSCLDSRPATVSPKVIGDLIRGELGYRGVVATDALNMGAIARTTGIVGGAIAALAAGADLLCVNGDLDSQAAMVVALEEAVGAGEVPLARVEEAAQRVAAVASAFPLPADLAASPPSLTRRGLGLAAARRALAAGPLPAPLPGPPYVVELTSQPTGIEGVRTRLTDALRRRDPRTEGVAFALDAMPNAETVLAAAGDRPLVLGVRDALRRPAHNELVAAVLARRPDAILVGLGSTADAVLAPDRFVPARGAAPPNVDAVAEVLLGDAH